MGEFDLLGLTYEDVHEHHVVLRGERHIQRLVLKKKSKQTTVLCFDLKVPCAPK